MTTIQIKELNSTDLITCEEQQQVRGGVITEKLLSGYANGTYSLEQKDQLSYVFKDNRGSTVGSLIIKNGYNFYIGYGYVEAIKGGSIDSTLNLAAALRV